MSSPKIFFVVSEAHQCEISCCIEKNEKSYVLEGKYAKNNQKWPKMAKLANFENVYLLCFCISQPFFC